MNNKFYTSIEQSKKLLELGLSPESADMCYVIDYAESNKYGKNKYNLQVDIYGFLVHNDDNIPCWSLAALLGVLPKNLNIGRPSLESNYMGYYWIQYYDEFMKPNDYKTECFDNPIDACYELILKLNELNLL